MNEIRRILDERKTEIFIHLAFIAQLEALATGAGQVLAIRVDTDALNILKSGMLLHIYNVVEAVMSKVLQEIGAAAESHLPRNWCDGLLKEWAVGRVNLTKDILISNAEDRIVELLREAVERSAVTQVKIRRRSGNWSDREIVKLADALQCTLTVSESVRRAACETVFQDERAPMGYIRHMRNQLAHGNLSFVEGARHLPSRSLRELCEAVIEYMSEVADSFDNYIDNRRYLAHTNP